eukprot:GHVS01039634.1.p1 GENE.GHVS01039634.1~~GHVS01039634.1.p1  ORF type:complete len:303 (+),score=48.78 GHVS01039634.1:975-1883(+)
MIFLRSRLPWKMSEGSMSPSSTRSSLHTTDLPPQPSCEDEATTYSEQIYRDELGREHSVPTLREVLDKFHDKLKFNIELKGNNENIGPKVLEICSRYPQCVLRISSFCWIPPSPLCCLANKQADSCCGKCGQVHRYPNGNSDTPPPDLLCPLVNNSMNIPLALLFNREDARLPSAERVVECLDKYNSDWAHLRFNCHITDDTNKDDNNSGDAAGVIGQSTGSSSGEDLRAVVEHLKKRNKKVMTFWGQKGEDREVDIRRSIESGVHAICPNDPELAIEVVRKHHRGEEIQRRKLETESLCVC